MTDWKISIILQLIDLDIINSTSDFANEKTEQKSNLHTEPRLNKNNGIYAWTRKPEKLSNNFHAGDLSLLDGLEFWDYDWKFIVASELCIILSVHERRICSSNKAKYTLVFQYRLDLWVCSKGRSHWLRISPCSVVRRNGEAWQTEG